MGRDTLKKLAAEETEIKAWLDQHKDDFFQALGLWADEDMIVLYLAKMRDFIGGQWSGVKDDIDRAGCDVLSPFLGKQQVDLDELRLAVGLLVQRFNACCDRVYRLQSKPHPRPNFPPRLTRRR